MRRMDEAREVWRHSAWADRKVAEAVVEAGGPAEALSEMAHVIGTEETWLARLQSRPPRLAVWPPIEARDLMKRLEATHEDYASLLDELSDSGLAARVSYRNSAGDAFENAVGDILLHVALHGQYHRGKVNLLLRQAGIEPAPCDYIALVRGAPAATRRDGA